MNARTLLMIVSTGVLSACFPAKEMTRENAQQVLSAHNRLSQIQDTTKEGFNASTLNNQSLERLLIKSLRSTPLTGDCYDGQGSYLFSQSETEDKFSLVFDQCAGDDGGKLDGTIDGEFEIDNDTYQTRLNGDLTASRNGNTITFSPLSMTLDFVLSPTELSFSMSHGGIYDYDTQFYKGKVTVVTEEPIGYSTATQRWGGKVTYTDASDNVLSVEHDNNGVHLSFNGAYLKSFTTAQWLDQFN